MYFNHDYTTEVQNKRRRDPDIIKQLKERNVGGTNYIPCAITDHLRGWKSNEKYIGKPRRRGINVRFSVMEEDKSKFLKTLS